MAFTVAPRPATIPTTTGPQHQLAVFPTYAGAEKLVETLSSRGFPVEHTRIVGNHLRSVEYVTGRMTPGRAASAGAVSGAWAGLFIGLLIGAFSTGNSEVSILVSTVFFGAVWFALFGFVAQRATSGKRDFASVKGIEAAEYVVSVDAELANDAIRAAGLV